MRKGGLRKRDISWGTCCLECRRETVNKRSCSIHLKLTYALVLNQRGREHWTRGVMVDSPLRHLLNPLARLLRHNSPRDNHRACEPLDLMQFPPPGVSSRQRHYDLFWPLEHWEVGRKGIPIHLVMTRWGNEESGFWCGWGWLGFTIASIVSDITPLQKLSLSHYNAINWCTLKGEAMATFSAVNCLCRLQPYFLKTVIIYFLRDLYVLTTVSRSVWASAKWQHFKECKLGLDFCFHIVPTHVLSLGSIGLQC